MKSRPNPPRKLADVAEDYNNAVVGLCLSCTKPVKGGFYGQTEGGGTCSKTCEQDHQAKPKYGEYTEEAFLKRFNL